MNEHELNQRLRQEIESETPDVLQTVLERCRQETQDLPIPSSFRPRRSPMFKWIGGIAAMFVFVIGIFYAQTLFRVDSIIDLDVNPGVELATNRNGRVLSATATNQDGLSILDGMDLKNTQVEVAVNALLGSMLKQGYLTNTQNSILVSVKNSDTNKGAALQASLTQEIEQLLAASSIEGAILSQSIVDDDALKNLADQYDISEGKALLIQSILQKHPTRTFSDLEKLSINDLNLIASSKGVTENLSTTGNPSDKAYIGESAALQTALDAAKLTKETVQNIKVEFDSEDGTMLYEVEYSSAGYEYEYEISATTGKILKAEAPEQAEDIRNAEMNSNQTANPSTTKPSGSNNAPEKDDDSDDDWDDDEHDDHDSDE